MPKKHHRKPLLTKPADRVVHHTLLSSSSRDNNGAVTANSNNGSSTSAAAEHEPSVNDLIDHLRRTQVLSSPRTSSPLRNRTNIASTLSPRTVHPSIRSLFELPETPPPRPRPNSGVGRRRVRRTPGPPPPSSWLNGGGRADHDGGADSSVASTTATSATEAHQMRNVIYRLERLPGAVFRGKGGLMDTVLRAMALNWAWHVEYDGLFLARLPCSVKVLLLSYLAVYSRGARMDWAMKGLAPLFLKMSDEKVTGERQDEQEDYFGIGDDLDVSRLDLGAALGRWLTFGQLTNELLVRSPKSESKLKGPQGLRSEEAVPTSWDEDAETDQTEEGEDPPAHVTTVHSPAPTIRQLESGGLRFANLRFLSLAHPDPAAANWNSLIKLLASVKSITHLSLAHWPVPTATPNAINATVRHPVHRSLTFSYSGTDAYSAMEDNWAEAVAFLRKLARATYCLQWLDLEGCGDWIRALSWEGVGPDGEPYGSTGHIWNGAWRNIEFLGLGPGWVPSEGSMSEFGGDGNFSRSLACSVHAPPRGKSGGDDDNDGPAWDVEVERIKYRRAGEIQKFRQLVEDAEAIGKRILDVRRQAKGKWLHFSLG